MSKGQQVRCKGQRPSINEPFYRLMEEINFYFIVEYCGQVKTLSKDEYEVVK